VLGHNDIGNRVVVRRLLGKRDNRPLYTDALGELVDATETHLTVRTADGPTRIARADIVAAKRVPARRARSATERLELVAARGWPAPDVAELGDWLLRAADGWTARGNSALAIGDPGRPVPEAIDAVVAWYRERGLPPAITVPEPLGRRVAPELRRRGWTARPPSLVQTAPLDRLIHTPAAADPGIRIDAAPSEEWLAAVGGRKGGMPAAGRHILSAPAEVAFASGYGQSGELVATARGVHTDGWLGLSVVGVAPDQRRRGWARRLSQALGEWGRAHGAARVYLQVEEHNGPAVALYAGMGFTTAHSYVTNVLADQRSGSASTARQTARDT
jgi:N-acetylglutamate synthase